MWGTNFYGGLGTGNTIYRSSPVQVGAGSDWYQADAGVYTTGAIKTDGTLWAWGYNGQGQLGQNNRTYTSSPVQVGALTTWAQVSTQSFSMGAVKTDGTLWMWGL